MHDSAMAEVRRFVEKYVTAAVCVVAEIGSMDVNGSPRNLFAGKDYTGFDIQAGKSVDVVMSDPEIIPAADSSFDLVISLNTLEHTRRPWRLMAEMSRILRSGGTAFALMPAYHAYHARPIDCWRAYAEGMRGLMQDADLKILEVYDTDGHDCVGIGQRAWLKEAE